MLNKFIIASLTIVFSNFAYSKNIYLYQDLLTNNTIITDVNYSGKESMHLKRVINYPKTMDERSLNQNKNKPLKSVNSDIVINIGSKDYKESDFEKLSKELERGSYNDSGSK